MAEHHDHNLDKCTAGLEVQANANKERIDKLEARLDKDFVTQREFEPFKKIVYGFVGLILTGVVLAMLALVIRKGP